MNKIYILTISMILTTINLHAQNIETFEDETHNTKTFTTNGQSFTIESGINDSFSIVEKATYGWNGGADSFDHKYIDNAGDSATNDGSSFTIKTTDSVDIYINSLYLYLGSSQDDQVINETLTIVGKKNGITAYTIIKTRGFATTNIYNGFTYIDFSTENGVDNSAINVDELVFSSTSTADYLALDYLTWSSVTLSTSDFEGNASINLYPNPSSESIQLSGLNNKEKYKIYNAVGSEIAIGTISNNKKIDIRNFTNGLYYLKLNSGNTLIFMKE